MSDYAGVIGNVVTIVGSATGQVWLQAAGMAISAWGASQQVLPGPKIGDVQRQTSQEGGFRPIVYGRSHPIMGNIIADGGPVIVTRRERQGKGGPKVESESAYRTYAVGVCEGEAQLLQAWRNGILVYDAEDPSMAAENAKFLEYARWFTGSFDQNASPDLEEIYGVGNAPFFRGTAYLVLANEDVTDQRGAWSQWQFRVFRGAARSYTTPPYPLFTIDSFGAGGVATGGSESVSLVESASISSICLGGALRDQLQQYESPIEEMGIQSACLGGELVVLDPKKTYQLQNEQLSVLSVCLGGELPIVRIPYQNYEHEDIGISSVCLGGTLI